jgi:hypothetical protein
VSDRPILFSAPMVRAILEGRKTQTRRVVKPQPPMGCRYEINGARSHALCVATGTFTDGRPIYVPPTPQSVDHRLPCPYGAPGDTLWVRETFFEEYDPDTCKPYDPPRYAYRATYEGEEPYQADGDGFPEVNRDGTFKSPWKPSIHMPREASRLTLCIKSVRVERLQEISEADAIAEGLSPTVGEYTGPARSEFAALWDSISRESHPWASTPWVWVLEFERVGGAS